MAAKSVLLLGVLVAFLLVCLDVACAQKLTETNDFGRNIGNGGAFGRGYGQSGNFGGRGRGYQRMYGRGYGPRYGGWYGGPRYGGGSRYGGGPRYNGGPRYGSSGYGAALGNGFGTNRFQIGL